LQGAKPPAALLAAPIRAYPRMRGFAPQRPKPGITPFFCMVPLKFNEFEWINISFPEFEILFDKLF
jgi:hypothetical protein